LRRVFRKELEQDGTYQTARKCGGKRAADEQTARHFRHEQEGDDCRYRVEDAIYQVVREEVAWQRGSTQRGAVVRHADKEEHCRAKNREAHDKRILG